MAVMSDWSPVSTVTVSLPVVTVCVRWSLTVPTPLGLAVVQATRYPLPQSLAMLIQ